MPHTAPARRNAGKRSSEIKRRVCPRRRSNKEARGHSEYVRVSENGIVDALVHSSHSGACMARHPYPPNRVLPPVPRSTRARGPPLNCTARWYDDGHGDRLALVRPTLRTREPETEPSGGEGCDNDRLFRHSTVSCSNQTQMNLKIQSKSVLNEKKCRSYVPESSRTFFL